MRMNIDSGFFFFNKTSYQNKSLYIVLGLLFLIYLVFFVLNIYIFYFILLYFVYVG